MRGRLISLMPRIYWSAADLPAVQRLAPNERRAVLRRYTRRMIGDWRLWAWQAAGVAGATLLIVLTRNLLAAFIWLAVVAVALWQWSCREGNRLILHDNPHLCRACGYDLRATPDRCPECGGAVPVPASPTPHNQPLERTGHGR